jgi:hypothetical protein
MATTNRLETLRQKLTSDSASWGSLLILAVGIAVLVVLMVLFSQGWLMPPVIG